MSALGPRWKLLLDACAHVRAQKQNRVCSADSGVWGLEFRVGTHWGNIKVILGLYWDSGKDNGNLCSIFRV